MSFKPYSAKQIFPTPFSFKGAAGLIVAQIGRHQAAELLGGKLHQQGKMQKKTTEKEEGAIEKSWSDSQGSGRRSRNSRELKTSLCLLKFKVMAWSR